MHQRTQTPEWCGSSIPLLNQGFYGGLIARERDCGQFPQTCEPEALQEFCSCRKAQPAVGAGEFLHELEIAKFHNEPALVSVEKEVNLGSFDERGNKVR